MTLNIGAATSILVIVEYLLSVIVIVVVGLTITLRARRLLYQNGSLDLSEIAWASRGTIHPRLVLAAHPTALLNLVRVVVPLGILISFVFIGGSLDERLSESQFEKVNTTTFAQTSFWDTIGRKKIYSVQFMQNAGRMGEWKGVPELNTENEDEKQHRPRAIQGRIPADVLKFQRLKWRKPSAYSCKKIGEALDEEYGFSVRKKEEHAEPHGRAFYETRTRVYKVGKDIKDHLGIGWFVSDHRRDANTGGLRSEIAKRGDGSTVVDEKLLEPGQDFKNKTRWQEGVSSAAFLLNFTDWQYQIDPYTTLLSRSSIENPETIELCKKIMKLGIVVDFIGIKGGYRSVQTFGPRGQETRVDFTRGKAVKQRFRCVATRQKEGNCDIPIVSTLSLVAGMVVGRNQSEVASPLDGADFYLADPLKTNEVADALEVGPYVLLAGASAKLVPGIVSLAKSYATLSWVWFASVLTLTLSLCVIMLGRELIARCKLGKLYLDVEPPLDPMQMAKACGAYAPSTSIHKREPTPIGALRTGVKALRTIAEQTPSISFGALDKELNGVCPGSFQDVSKSVEPQEYSAAPVSNKTLDTYAPV